MSEPEVNNADKFYDIDVLCFLSMVLMASFFAQSA